tara:strand:+ start:311 stop:1714 length:1404 start_codon:yes stop_codon:yes gene_type:complete
MAYLQTKDFTKGASAGNYAGKDRHTIVELKIKDKKPFIISATETGPKVYGVSYDKATKTLVYKTSLSSKQSKSVSILKIFKDKDFGGGASGSGGGADLTRIAESAQCYYCSYAFNVAGKELKKPPTLKELGTSARYVQADMNLYDAMNKCPEDWHETFVKTANILVKTYKNKISGTVFFHRGSNFMKKIYEAKAQVMKDDKQSDTPQAPGSFSNDKWNPGDIWMSTYPTTEYPLTNKYKTWSELNQQVLEKAGKLGGKTRLLGISLKKITSVSAKITEFNLPKRINNVNISFEGFRYGKKGDFFSSQDIYMYMSGQEVQFRTFGGVAEWQGEIKGASAAGGKIGGGNVNFYCRKHIGQNIGGSKGDSWNERSILNRIDVDRIYELYNTFYNKQNTFQKAEFPIVPKPEFVKTFNTQSLNFRASKYMCMVFLETFYKGTPKQRNKVVTEMIRYAASNTDQSSYFIKVS